MEGGTPSSAAGPALRPIDWALPPSGGRGGKSRAGSAVARRVRWQLGDPVLPSTGATLSAYICPRADFLPLPAKAPTGRPHCRCPRATRLFSGGPGRLICRQMRGWVFPPQSQGLLLPLLKALRLGSRPLGKPPHFSSLVFSSVKWDK